MSGLMTPPLTPVKGNGVFGYCYASLFGDDAAAASGALGCLPTLREVVDYSVAKQEAEDSDFGPWSYNIDSEQVDHGFDGNVGNFDLVPVTGNAELVAYHVAESSEKTKFYLQLSRAVKELRVGVDFADLVKRCGDCTGPAERFAMEALANTTAIAGDSSSNYDKIGDLLQTVRAAGVTAYGLTRSRFTELVHAVIARWASPREASAAARLAACLVYNSDAEPWSVDLLEEAMDPMDSENEKQVKLLRIAGMVFCKRAAQVIYPEDRREGLAPWKCDLSAPSKVFTSPAGLDSVEVGESLKRGAEQGVSGLVWAAKVLGENLTTPVETMATIAAGGAVAATAVAAAGLALDWYYESKSEKPLGSKRETRSGFPQRFNHVPRVKELLAVGGALSDDTYDTQTHTQVIRLDPFFFSVKSDLNRLKDDTAAQRQLTNTVLPPLLQNMTTNNKVLINLPGSISDESARHIQDAMPEFYFRIVNRSHSHPELWAVRRAFEMIVARRLVDVDGCKRSLMVGGNVRQVSKIPGVCLNYGPQLSGRDEARHRAKGTAAQRAFYRRVNVDEKFGKQPRKLEHMVAVAMYSTQDMSKQRFVEAMIKSSVTSALVAVNIPIVMMDNRIVKWDDTVLNCRFVKRGKRLSMAPLGMPVAGYNNSFRDTMSWAKPIVPFLGYDVTCEVISCVGSSYLISIDVGCGPQEAHDTIWKMPDAGHYVLHDLTRTDGVMDYFTVPAAKFDQVVKFVIQLNGAKNVIEATAGRILGLEAQIKIGGNVLERAWGLSHQEFASVMIHAVVCSGVTKGDALFMLSRLRQHFDTFATRSYLESALFGFKKLFGLDRDLRSVPKLKRGANDYYAVKHWTMIQLAGDGWAEAFEEGGVGIPPKLPLPASSVPEPVIVDEGYHSVGDLNEDDCSDASSVTGPDQPTVLDRMTKWLRPRRDSAEVNAVGGDFHGFVPNARTRQLMIGIDELGILQTESRFDPTGPLSFDRDGSRCQGAFADEFASEEDVRVALAENRIVMCPDVGAVQIVLMAVNADRRVKKGFTYLHRHVRNVESNTVMERLEDTFYDEVGPEEEIAAPQLLLDGLAGSAKSSMVAAAIKERSISSAIVCPTRKLALEWRAKKVGTVVTKHKLMKTTLRGRSLLVIDEAYAYTKAELHALLWKAAFCDVKVLLLGDRRQQYEDGGEIMPSDLESLGTPILRLCVSNTMPADALKIAKWAADDDLAADLFQTRSRKVHSIHVIQRDQLEDVELVKNAVVAKECLVYKDRMGPELHYTDVSDSDLGFRQGEEDSWLSVSRVQGMRSKHSMLLTSRFTKSEKWFADQRGLLYVATSRHSHTMLWTAEQTDLGLLRGLEFDTMITVEGRLAVLQARERFDAPMLVLEGRLPKFSPLLKKLQERGMTPQTAKFRTAGALREDWRPWHKFTNFDDGSAAKVMEATTLRLAGEQVPYVFTDSAKMPIYTQAMGLYSMRRPAIREADEVDAKFAGMNRLAVLQNSRDEHLDLKNVIERTARPRSIDKDPYRVRVQSEQLFELFKHCYLDVDTAHGFSTFPSAEDWASSRTADFSKKFEDSDSYGSTAFSTRSQGFLKTQTKVKLKRSFALEENYGQTVLASPADFNGKFGPWSKMILRNIRLCTRVGVVMDSGFSDKDLAREFRRLGVMPRFSDENYQADVKRQDTSHTPVTLKVFCMLLKFVGMPEELADLYELHSAKYEYHSMHAGLYRGEANYNLGSGDPFTLIRNIVEVLTVMLERYGEQMADMNMVVKGDDFLSDKIPVLLPVSVQEVRDTQLTEDFNKPPYHAGRFFLPDDILPDPVRMVTKVLVKRSDDSDRVNQLAESFYDKYVHLTDYSYALMREYVVRAYEDFEPEFPLAALDLYHAMRDRSMFFELVGGDAVSASDKLVVVNQDEDCIYWAASWFIKDPCFLTSLRHESREVIHSRLASRHVPSFEVRGRPNDFLKKGVWMTEGHAWAVVGLTEFNEQASSD